jgi:hypothetical protein
MTHKLDSVVAKYIALRDERDALKKRQAAEVAVITDQMDRIEAAIMKFFLKSGQNSARTKSGTPYIQTRVAASVADRDAFLAFVQQEGAFEFLENRVNKTAVQQYMEDNEEAPPGIKVTSTQVLNITRSK